MAPDQSAGLKYDSIFASVVLFSLFFPFVLPIGFSISTNQTSQALAPSRFNTGELLKMRVADDRKRSHVSDAKPGSRD